MRKLTLVLVVMLAALCALVPAAAADEAVPTKAKIEASVSFRDLPTTSSNVMRYLKSGEIVTVLNMVNPNWNLVQDAQGVQGYVSSSSKYISIISNAKIIYGVNFRNLPTSEGSKVIRMLAKGEEILIQEKVNDNWYRIQDSNGVTGYMSTSSKYTTADFSVTGLTMPKADLIEQVIATGYGYMGTPYEFGSTRFDTVTFDCSDFLQQAFWDTSRIVIPSDSRAQGDYVKALGSVSTDWKQLKRGDLMFFMSYIGSDPADYNSVDKANETITHVGMYLGDGTILHTYSPESGGVRVDSIDGKQWENRFLFGGSAVQ